VSDVAATAIGPDSIGALPVVHGAWIKPNAQAVEIPNPEAMMTAIGLPKNARLLMPSVPSFKRADDRSAAQRRSAARQRWHASKEFWRRRAEIHQQDVIGHALGTTAGSDRCRSTDSTRAPQRTRRCFDQPFPRGERSGGNESLL
jgi:hypothetical protein